ncbi:MAG: hypothetical protein Q9192_003247 [Flavoplaca navasiana]
MDDHETLTRSPSDQSRESVCDPGSQSDADIFSPKSPQNDIPYRARTHSNRTLAVHHHTKLKYLHRTARDFLLNTEDGRRLSGKPRDTPITRSINIVRARMAALVQGLLEFEPIAVESLIMDIKAYFSEGNPKEKHETESLIFLRRLCESLSVPGDPERHIGYTTFWGCPNPGFEGMAAVCGCTEYVQNFVQDRASYINPRRRGLLVIHALRNSAAVTEPGKRALVSCRPEIREEPLTRVPLIGIATKRDKVLLRLSELNLDAPCVCPSEKDSLYLGEALDRILFPRASTVRTCFEDLNARLDVVSERSGYKKLDVWKREYTEAVDQNGELARDCEMDLESLGDKWYV